MGAERRAGKLWGSRDREEVGGAGSQTPVGTHGQVGPHVAAELEISPRREHEPKTDPSRWDEHWETDSPVPLGTTKDSLLPETLASPGSWSGPAPDLLNPICIL